MIWARHCPSVFFPLLARRSIYPKFLRMLNLKFICYMIYANYCQQIKYQNALEATHSIIISLTGCYRCQLDFKKKNKPFPYRVAAKLIFLWWTNFHKKFDWLYSKQVTTKSLKSLKVSMFSGQPSFNFKKKSRKRL